MSFLASIPSPSHGTIDLGPLTIHMYGLTLLVAIGICIWITGTRFVNRGGDWDIIFRCAVWGVGAGIVGARLYHLATSWNEVPDQWWGALLAFWKELANSKISLSYLTPVFFSTFLKNPLSIF